MKTRIKRGYLYSGLSSLLIGTMYGFKYSYILKENSTESDLLTALINSAILFVILLICSFILTRWYYKIKNG